MHQPELRLRGLDMNSDEEMALLARLPPRPERLSADQVRQLMQLILWKLESLRQWEKDSITATIQAVVESLELKLRDAMPLMFAAVTGQASSVSVLDAMEILGPDLTRFRLRQAIELLGGVSKKENKEWEKLLAAIA